MRLPTLFLLSLPCFAQLVKVAPYYTPGIGTQSLTTNATTDTSMDVISSGVVNRLQMPFTGPVFQLTIYLADTTDLQSLEFSKEHCTTYATNVCTVYTATYSAAFTGPFAANAVNTFTLATPFAMSLGDVIGVHPAWTQPHSASLALFSAQLFPVTSGNGDATQAETCYYQLNANRPATFTLSGMTLITNAGCVPIGMVANAPFAVEIGDSIASGSQGFCTTSDVWQRVQSGPNCPQLGYWLAEYPATPNQTWMHMGWSGQTSTQILTRFTADALNLQPQVLVIEGYINDVSGCGSGGCSGAQITSIESNLTSMMSQAQTAGVPIRLAMSNGPWGVGSNAQMTSADTVATWLIANAPAYGFKVIDFRCTLGVFRSGGTAGNCWNWNATYMEGDGLQIHPNIAGYQLIAPLFHTAVPYISGGAGGFF